MYTIQVQRGVRLAVQDLNPGGRHTILFVHGWPLNQKIFEYQTEVLADQGFHCTSYDLRGYGRSDKPLHGYSYNRMADDLFRVIQSIPCRSLTLLGFSMGGAICTRYMARHRGYKVSKLVLCGAACPSFVKTEEHPYGMECQQVDDLIRQCYKDRPAMAESFGKLCFATRVSDPFMRWFSSISWDAAGYATIKSLEALREERLFDDLKAIRVPTMIMHGTKDAVCPFPLALEMEELVCGSILVPFENSSHALFYDEKEKFNQELMEFAGSRK